MLLSGTRLGDRYQLVRHIGGGAYGDVFEALQRGVARRVALKILRSDDPQAVARFQREAHLAARVEHRNVVRIFDAGLIESRAFIAMELLQGPSLLQEVRRKGPLSTSRALTISQGVARGLATAHHHGVLHRDIKPSNILLRGTDERAQPVLVDFGLAGGLDRGSLTGSTAIVGTPAYMAPETLLGGVASVESDLYALGCCMYVLWTGRRPYPSRTLVELALDHADAPIPRLSACRSDDVPVELDRLVTSLMAKDPNDRPGSAEEVGDELAWIAHTMHDKIDSAYGSSADGSVRRFKRLSLDAPSFGCNDYTASTVERQSIGDGSPIAVIAEVAEGPAIAEVALDETLPAGPIHSDDPAANNGPRPTVDGSTAHAGGMRRPARLRTLAAASAIIGTLAVVGALASLTSGERKGTSYASIQESPLAYPLVGTAEAVESPPVVARGSANDIDELEVVRSRASLTSVVRRMHWGFERGFTELRQTLVSRVETEEPSPRVERPGRESRRERAESRELGELTVVVLPYGDVQVGGGDWTESPLNRYPISAGSVTIRTRYRGSERTERVRVSASREVRLIHQYDQ